MDFGSRNALTDRLFGSKATCPCCGNQFTFRAGAELVREKGIHDNVVACGGCRHVYTCSLIPGRLTLLDDVTERYPGMLVKADREEQPEKEPETQPVKRRGFFSGIFGKQRRQQN